VPHDDAIELQLVDEFKAHKAATRPPERQSAPAPAPRITAASTAATVTPTPAASCDGTAALDIFCRAAGLAPADLRGKAPEEAFEAAGVLMRTLVTGLADLLRARSPMKEALRQPPAIARPAFGSPANNPAQVADALRYLLSESGDSGLPAEYAVQAAFLELKGHQQASVKAMIHAMRDLIERFEPEELRNRFDRGLKRSALLASANKLKYWELYEEHYLTLTHQDEGAPLPRMVIDELTRAYEQEVHAATQPVLSRPSRVS
jgi:type VI secretion system FHA domain protein